MANFEAELNRLAESAARLANLFDRVSDGIEAGTISPREAASVATNAHAVGQAAPWPKEPPARDATAAEAAALTHAASEPGVELDRSQSPFANQMPTAAANYPAPTPDPAFSTEPSGNSEAPPWEAQAATEAEKPAEEKPAKKGGRRTNEELAADAGVDLDEVKAWLGEGKRVTKASIDEFAKLKASQNGQAQPAAEVPTEAASPFGGQPQAAPQAADPWPATAQPQFGTWPPAQQQGGFDPANPFGG